MDLERQMNRRALLRALAGGAASLSLVPLLAACGGDEGTDEGNTPTSGTSANPTNTTGAAPAGASPTTVMGSPRAEADPEASPAGSPQFSGQSLVIYSGRNEELVGPIIERFEQAEGIEVEVRYGDTAELAALLLEEGDASPADLFFAQDAGALGAVAKEGLFTTLPEDVLSRVEERFRSPDGEWVGITGRARVVVYNTEQLTEEDMPDSILGFTDAAWEGKLGWAPTNGSFQAFVTSLRVLQGDDTAREWLEGVQANGARVFEGNSAIVNAVIAGEISAGFVNHYYLMRQRAEAGDDLPAENFFYTNADAGALVNVAGAGVLDSSDKQDVASRFVAFMLEQEAQEYFATQTFEYPLITGVEPDPRMPPLEMIQTPDIDLSDLSDLEGTLELLRDVGLL